MKPCPKCSELMGDNVASTTDNIEECAIATYNGLVNIEVIMEPDFSPNGALKWILHS